jgi:hypothetical protein
MFRKPWENGACAYHVADSIQEAKKGFSRCRKTQHFILSSKCIDKGKIICGICNKTIKEKDGNRCEYIPALKKVLPMHYYCAWDSLLIDIYGKLYDKLV